MTQSRTTTPPNAQQADTQLIQVDAAQRAREQRYQRAIAGWVASRVRTRGHQLGRDHQEQPAAS